MHVSDWRVSSNKLQLPQCQRSCVDLLRVSGYNWRKPKPKGTSSRPETTGNHVHPLPDPVRTQCTDSSTARGRAGVVRLVARRPHRSQGHLRIRDTEHGIHGRRRCSQVGGHHHRGDFLKCGHVQQRSFCRGGRESRYGLGDVRVGEASNPGPPSLFRLRRVGLGMRISSALRGSGEVEVVVSSDDNSVARVTEPALSIPTWTDESQEVTQATQPAPSLLPTWPDMSRGDEAELAREPQRRRITPRQGRPDPVRVEDEVDDVVSALERDLPVVSHTPTTMSTGRRLVLMPQTAGGTPCSIQDCGTRGIIRHRGARATRW